MCEDEIIPDQSPESIRSDSVIDNPTAVCGTNGITYPSLCHLLQDTGNEAVAYAGGCNREDCQGGPVSIMSISNHEWTIHT